VAGQSLAIRHRASAVWPPRVRNFSAELLHELAGRSEIGKASPKIDLAFSNNSPSVSRLYLSRPVKLHHSAAHFDIQFFIGGDKLDDVGIFPLVCGRFFWHVTTAAHSARGAIYCVADNAI